MERTLVYVVRPTINENKLLCQLGGHWWMKDGNATTTTTTECINLKQKKKLQAYTIPAKNYRQILIFFHPHSFLIMTTCAPVQETAP